MKNITNVRIENGQVALFKINTGEVYTKAEIYSKMMLNGERFTIATENGIKDLRFNSDGTKVVSPPLAELQFINTL